MLSFLGMKTLSSRLTIFLALGGSITCVCSLLLAELHRDYQLAKFRAERIAMSAEDVANRLKHSPISTKEALLADRILGARLIKQMPTNGKRDADLDKALLQIFPKESKVHGIKAPAEECIGNFRDAQKTGVAGFVPVIPECWIVKYSDTSAQQFIIALPMPPMPLPAGFALRPLFLLFTLIISYILSYIVVRLTLRFMRRLRQATGEFARDINSEPIAEIGPLDVVETYRAFNAMQDRIRTMMRERTEMLAAISHDLQTPLTRLRLRSEALTDQNAQKKILMDIAGMERLVREGLALARSHETIDDWAILDVESLLHSIVDDAHDEGKYVTIDKIEMTDVRVKPDALMRCLQNLIDNAVQYGKSAELSCASGTYYTFIMVRDRGAGLPEQDLERMFMPFIRGEKSRSRNTGGTGIGLTIAKAQAATFGASVYLKNADDGGLIATIEIPKFA